MEKACKGWEVLNADDYGDINPGDRVLMGPEPSHVPARTCSSCLQPLKRCSAPVGTDRNRGALAAATAVCDEACRPDS